MAVLREPMSGAEGSWTRPFCPSIYGSFGLTMGGPGRGLEEIGMVLECQNSSSVYAGVAHSSNPSIPTPHVPGRPHQLDMLAAVCVHIHQTEPEHHLNKSSRPIWAV